MPKAHHIRDAHCSQGVQSFSAMRVGPLEVPLARFRPVQVASSPCVRKETSTASSTSERYRSGAIFASIQPALPLPRVARSSVLKRVVLLELRCLEDEPVPNTHLIRSLTEIFHTVSSGEELHSYQNHTATYCGWNSG